MLFKLKGNDDDLAYYAEANSPEECKEKVEELTGYLKPQHITITPIQPDELPEDEVVL